MTNHDNPPHSNGEAPAKPSGGVQLLVLGVFLALFGLALVAFSSYQFDMVKDHVLTRPPAWAPFGIAVGVLSTLSGFVMALIHFIREG